MTMLPQYFDLANLFFISVVLVLIAFILISMYLRIKIDEKRQKWKLMADLLIRNAIFFEESESGPASKIPTTPRTKILLKNPHFRKVLKDELINAKKSLSGSSSENLVRLYRQLDLHKYALKSLKNGKWYIKAQVIQELSILGLKENLTKIYRFINNPNDLVRMEAQIAVVRLYGFDGLRFLDVISYPVTEWQQIKLLHELSHVPPENFRGIEKWIKSKNKTVVTFALKLARIYHRFELQDIIITCLEDGDSQVRQQAIISLGEIYDDDTSALLIRRYLKEGIKNQMAIIQVLQNIATNDDIPFLFDQLNTKNADLKMMLARALAKVGTKGLASLQHHDQAQQYPLKEIIAQVKSEFAL